MLSTMRDFPLTITALLWHGATVHSRSQVVTLTASASRRASFAEVARPARRLGAALRRLGVGAGDRVGTFCWNTQEHLEAYFAVPCMGAVLHTINIRLFPAEVAYIIEHAGDRVLIVDVELVPAMASALAHLTSRPEQIIVVGEGDASALGEVLRYETLIAGEEDFDWPELDERAAAAMCYTSGTTGRPKGVVYSHRSTFLHSVMACTGSVLDVGKDDRILPVVPMFHANAWGLPYAAWVAGADLVLPGRFIGAADLARAFADERVTVTAAVPTVFRDLAVYGESHPLVLSSVRSALCGGSAVPASLIRHYEARYGVTIVQGWGMTETSPIAAIAHPPRDLAGRAPLEYRSMAGRIVPGVQLRIVDGKGAALPWDGEAEGEIEVRGPWITASYYREPTPEKFHDDWLRTGDVGSVDPQGFVRITDRAKDVIKSGGEWISSVALENALMAHAAVAEAAVIGVPDDKWQERPLACVVLRPGAAADAAALRAHLAGQVARWWLPERWAFIDQVPKTSVGKFDKKVLRRLYAEGALEVREVGHD